MNDIEVRSPGLLDAELNESERLRPLAASLTLNLYGSSEATITLPEDAPYIRIHDWVSLYTQNGFAGIFRVTNISRNFKRNLEITLLHGIDILSDSVWAEQDKFTGTMEEFLTKALNFQTHLVNGVKPWVLGTCEDYSTTFTDKEMNYDRLSTLLEGLIEEGGDYYYEYNMSTFPWTLNVRRKSSVVWSEFRLSRNVTTANVTYNDADLCTRLIVSVNNKTTEERGDYTVPSETVYPDQSAHGLIPDSSKAPGSTAEVTSNETTIKTYDSESGQRNWGIVVKTADIDLAEIRQTWPSVDAWAANFMGLRSQPSVQIQIDGEELAQLSGDNWDELALGRNCRVCLPTYSPGYFNERVVSVTYPDLFSRPSHVTVSLANALPKFSESITRIADKADSAASSARSAGRYAASAEELTKWSQIVEYYGEALDGTGVMTLYRSGIEMDAATGLKIYSLSQGVQSLYSGISVNTEGIESLVTKTGVNDLGQGESLYSKITQTAGQIQSVVSQTGVVAEEFDPNKTYAKGDRVLYNGTPYKFTAAHTGPWTGTDVTSIGDLQSQITQNASEISVRVTNQQLSSALQGYLLINDFSTELGNTLDTKDGTLAAKVTTLINVQKGTSQVRIEADQIFLDAAKTASIGDVFFFTAGGSLWVKRIAQFGTEGGSIVTINSGTVNAPTLQVNSGGSLTFSPSGQSGSAISINHSKAAAIVDSISKKNDLPEGQFGFHYTTVGNPNGADITFNIADTAFHTAAVSAAEINGRESVTVSSFTWNQPNVSDNPNKPHGKYYSISGQIQLGYQTGVDGQDNPIYTNIGNPIGTLPQEITGVYDAGWDNGSDSVTLNDTGWSSTNQRTISTVGRHTEEQSVTVSVSGVWDAQESSGTDAEKATAVYRILSAPAGTTPTDGNTLFTTSPVMSFQTYDSANHILTAQLKAGNKLLASAKASIIPGTATPGTPVYSSNGNYTLSASGTVNINGTDYALTGGTGTFFAEGAVNNGFGTCKNSITLNYTSNQTVQPGSPITIYPVIRTSYSDDTPVNLTAKGITISAAASSVTYTDDWGYGSSGNAEEPEAFAYYQVLANGTKVKATTIWINNNTKGTTKVCEYGGNTSPVIAQLDTPKVSSIVTSGSKIVLSSSDIGNNVQKQVTVTYSDGYSHQRTVYIDASAVYEAGQNSQSSGSYYEGKASVGLNDLSWTPVTGSSYPAYQTITGKTSGRTNTSGVAAEIEKTLRVEPFLTYNGTNIYAWLRAGSGYTNIARVSGTISVTGATVTSSQVAYNKTNRTARGQVAGTISGTVNNTTFCKTFTLNNVNFDWAYQAGLDGTTYRTRDYEFEDSGTDWSDEYPLDLSAVYQQGVTDATPVSDYPYQAKVETSRAGTGGSVNLRASSSTSASILTAIPNGATINTKVELGTTPNESGAWYNADWVEVQYGNFTGYVQSQFVLNTVKYWQTQPKYIYGVYSDGFTPPVEVGVKVPGRTGLVIFNLMNNKSAAMAQQGGLYEQDITGTPTNVYSSSWRAIGKTCYVCYSDGTTRSYTIEDENA